jgi:hypothetical protein
MKLANIRNNSTLTAIQFFEYRKYKHPIFTIPHKVNAIPDRDVADYG